MEFELGQTYSGYKFLDVTNRSKNGVEYRVQNTLAQRLELLKVLPPGAQDDQEETDRFMREMRVRARLVHPNIVTFFTAMPLEGRLVMTTELVEGLPLSERLELGAFPWRDAVGFARQVLSAVNCAHEQKIIHRDIRPENIIAVPGGVMKLTNFRLAKSVHALQLTHSGAILGNVKYISPEQVKGTEAVDHRADLYSVGIVLYEMLTGRTPFQSPSQFEVMLAHVNQPPDPPSRIASSVPPDVDAVVLKALAKSPGQRYQTALEFEQALGHLAGLDAAPAVPAVVEPEPPTWESLAEPAAAPEPVAVAEVIAPPAVEVPEIVAAPEPVSAVVAEEAATAVVAAPVAEPAVEVAPAAALEALEALEPVAEPEPLAAAVPDVPQPAERVAEAEPVAAAAAQPEPVAAVVPDVAEPVFEAEPVAAVTPAAPVEVAETIAVAATAAEPEPVAAGVPDVAEPVFEAEPVAAAAPAAPVEVAGTIAAVAPEVTEPVSEAEPVAAVAETIAAPEPVGMAVVQEAPPAPVAESEPIAAAGPAETPAAAPVAEEVAAAPAPQAPVVSDTVAPEPAAPAVAVPLPVLLPETAVHASLWTAAGIVAHAATVPDMAYSDSAPVFAAPAQSVPVPVPPAASIPTITGAIAVRPDAAPAFVTVSQPVATTPVPTPSPYEAPGFLAAAKAKSESIQWAVFGGTAAFLGVVWVTIWLVTGK